METGPAVNDGSGWGMGCWLCHHMGCKSAFGKLRVQSTGTVAIQNLLTHGEGKKHKAALVKLQASLEVTSRDIAPDIEGHISGLSSQVPRVDRFVAVATSVIKYDTYDSYKDRLSQLSIHSSLEVGGKGSQQEFKQMVACLDGPLQDRNRRVIKKAICSSIALDKSDDNLIMIARVLIPEGIFDAILGLESNVGPDVEHVTQAIENIVRRACVNQKSRRDVKVSLYDSKDDELDEAAMTTFVRSVRSAVADGGPVEQKALFLSSPSCHVLEQAPRQGTAYFRNLSLIDRDRPHRHRSVIRGMWGNLNSTVREFLDKLVTGQRSLCKLIQTSKRYATYFNLAQTGVKIEDFGHTIRNLSYSEVRFDSRSRPLFRLFRLLPVAIDTLRFLVEGGNDEERAFATELLALFSGDEGFVRVIGAAVAADAMVMGWHYIRLDDQAAADASLSGPRAAQLLHEMRQMLDAGGLFMEEASGTLTHAALEAMKNRLVYVGANKAVALGWPAAEGKRRRPRTMAKETLIRIYLI
ncbi:unnamed protein product [Symbiodinium sp. CCMP2456]|nr:unnamed protein product [Symbiodinium sp. CCMP2456]